MRLKTRMMILSSTIALSLCALVGGFIAGKNILTNQEKQLIQLENQAISLLDDTSSANIQFLLQIKEFKNALIRAQDATLLDKHKAGFKNHGKETQKLLDKAIQESTKAEIKESLTSIKEAHKQLDKAYQEGLDKIDPTNPASVDEIDKALNGVDKPTNAAFEKIAHHIDNDTKKEVTKTKNQLEKNHQQFDIAILIVAGLSFLTLMTMLYWNNRKIFQQIGGEPDEVRAIANEIAQGNLNTQLTISEKDKTSILYTLQIMRNQLRTLIQTIQEHSVSVSSSADELSASSEQLTVNISRQNEAASSMAAAVEEMTVSINHIAESAQEAAIATKSTGESASTGGATIASTAHKMQEIATSVIEAASTIATLGKQTQTISSITNVIKEVADQTNLLALNAAIEAARAGEEGRGFAVVADEVRNLAARTTQATSEISAMILNIQHEAKLAVSRMDSTNLLVTEGVKLANDAEHSIESIQSHVSAAIATIQEISDSLKEQSVVCQSIACKVEDVSQSSEENHSATINSSQQAVELQSHSLELHELVTKFKV